MTQHPKRLFLAGLLAASLGSVAIAQNAPQATAAQPAAGEASGRARMDPAQRQQRMAEHHAKRQAELKAQLKLTPAQEGAWNQYTSAMQPPAKGPRMERAEFDKLTTPQRIDRMQQRSAERQAQMKQRGDAVKAFYAQLTQAQQKTFDEQGARMAGQSGAKQGRGMHRYGQHDGYGYGPFYAPAAPAAQ